MPVAYSARGSSTLNDIAKLCRDDIPCPFLVHERPKNNRGCKTKAHPFQLTPGWISNGFADARDATGIFYNWDTGTKPTFHELIILGQHMRKKQGWSEKEIQQLRGHTSEKMTAHYQEGHTLTTVRIPAFSC